MTIYDEIITHEQIRTLLEIMNNNDFECKFTDRISIIYDYVEEQEKKDERAKKEHELLGLYQNWVDNTKINLWDIIRKRIGGIKMIIKLPNENFYIDFDKDGNYTLYETKVTQSGKNIGNEYASVIGYYNTLSSAVRRYISRQLGESEDTVTIEQFLEVYEKLVDEVTAFLTPKEVKL